jgi:hypothetical protein
VPFTRLWGSQARVQRSPITWAVVSTMTLPTATSPCRKSMNAPNLEELIEYGPQCPPVLSSQTLWKTNCTCLTRVGLSVRGRNASVLEAVRTLFSQMGSMGSGIPQRSPLSTPGEN